MKSEDEKKTEDVLNFALDLGKKMIKCGAEISRVEETVIRICYAYSMKKTDVFSIITMITATTTDKNGNTCTLTKRVYSYASNFDRLEQLNALSRKTCRDLPEISQARKELEEICSDKRKFNLIVMIGYMLGAGGFTVFFGGSFLDAVASMPIAVMIYFMNTYIRARGINKLFFTALCSLLAGTMALLFAMIGFGNDANMIMIGDIMLIIPGLMLINSFREMLCGDVMSGLLRLIESVIVSLSIAAGYAIPILSFNHFNLI